MNIEIEIKKIAKSPAALTMYILFSSFVLMQFITLFTGRWESIISLCINVVLVTAFWLMFGTAVTKDKKVSRAGFTCAWAWSLSQLIYQSVVALIGIIVSIFLMVQGFKTYWLTYKVSVVSGVFGLILLIVCLAAQTMLILYFIILMKEINKIKGAAGFGRYVPLNKKFTIFTAMAIAAKGAYVLLFTVFGPILRYSSSGLGNIVSNTYSTSAYWFAKLIYKYFSLPSTIIGFIAGGLEIAVLILSMILFNKYNKRVKRSGY